MKFIKHLINNTFIFRQAQGERTCVDPYALNAENAAKNLAERTMDDGVDWRSYVEDTRDKYIIYYKNFVQQNTNNHSGLVEEWPNIMNVAELLDLRGRAHDRVQLLTPVMDAARLLGYKSQEEHCLGQLGRDYMTLGELPTAAKCFEQAYTIAEEIDDWQGKASHLGNLGQFHLQQAADQLKAAVAAVGAVEAVPVEPPPPFVGVSPHMEGDVLIMSGSENFEYERFQYNRKLEAYENQLKAQENQLKAADYFQEAIKIARESGDRGLEGRLWASLVQVKLSNHTPGQTDDIIEAIKHFRRAIAIAQETGDRRGEASHFGCMGRAYELMGDMTMMGLSYCKEREGYERWRQSEYDRWQLEQTQQQNYRWAYEYYSHALSIAREINDEPMQKRFNGDLARVGPLKSPQDPPIPPVNYCSILAIWVRTGCVPPIYGKQCGCEKNMCQKPNGKASR
jgi:tetratricopeptide (TPR) repeat protein